MEKTSRHQRQSASTLRARCAALAGIAGAALAPAVGNAGSQQSAIEPVSRALSAQSSIDGSVVLVAVIIGALLAVLYIRGMYLVLHYASMTYNVSLELVDEADYSSSSERRLLSIGSVALVVVSAVIIASYGFGWGFLYIGPALSLLGPIVIIASMESDIRKYRKVLGETAGSKGIIPGSALGNEA